MGYHDILICLYTDVQTLASLYQNPHPPINLHHAVSITIDIHQSHKKQTLRPCHHILMAFLGFPPPTLEDRDGSAPPKYPHRESLSPTYPQRVEDNQQYPSPESPKAHHSFQLHCPHAPPNHANHHTSSSPPPHCSTMPHQTNQSGSDYFPT